jgi:hypothetical protein
MNSFNAFSMLRGLSKEKVPLSCEKIDRVLGVVLNSRDMEEESG